MSTNSNPYRVTPTTVKQLGMKEGTFGLQCQIVKVPDGWDEGSLQLPDLPSVPNHGNHAWVGGSSSPAHGVRVTGGEGALASISFTQRPTAYKPGTTVDCVVRASFGLPAVTAVPYRFECRLVEMPIPVYFIPWHGVMAMVSPAELDKLQEAGVLVMYKDSSGGPGYGQFGGRPPKPYFIYVADAQIPKPPDSSKYAVNPHKVPGADVEVKPGKDDWVSMGEQFVFKTLHPPDTAGELDQLRAVHPGLDDFLLPVSQLHLGLK